METIFALGTPITPLKNVLEVPDLWELERGRRGHREDRDAVRERVREHDDDARVLEDGLRAEQHDCLRGGDRGLELAVGVDEVPRLRVVLPRDAQRQVVRRGESLRTFLPPDFVRNQCTMCEFTKERMGKREKSQ